MNPEGLPFFINPSVLRTPPLYFALQNTGEEGNPLLIAVRYPAYGARQGEKVILDFVTATADIFLTPPSFGHLPYILRCKTQRRRVIVTLRLNSPRPFSSVSLATSPPDKGGIGVCAFACILIPSPFSPYCYRNFPQCYETRQGGGWEVFHFLPCFYFKCDTLSCYSCGNIGEWLDSNSSVKVRRWITNQFYQWKSRIKLCLE